MTWLLGNMLGASLVMLLVLAVRRPVATLLGAGPAYALWLLPAARLLMPSLPSFGTASFLPPLEVVMAVGEATAGLPAPSQLGWISLVIIAWAIGSIAFVGWQWLAYRSFLTRLSLASRSLGGHGGVPLVESAAVQGPLAIGLLDRRIVVPADFDSRYSEEERRLALEHEAIHHQRGDLWWNLAALAVLALNWFNPVAWLAFRAFREDQELACDAAVAARAAPEQRRDYASALIKSASRPGQIAACPLNHVDQLKRRLSMMNAHRRSPARLIGGAATIIALAGVSALLGSPGIAHPHPEGEQKEHRERVIVMTQKAGEGEAGEHRMRIRRGEGGEIVIPDCEGGETTRVDEGTENERTRIVLCTRGTASAAERAERLQRTRDRLARDTDMNAERRARVTAAIDREIARLRAQ